MPRSVRRPSPANAADPPDAWLPEYRTAVAAEPGGALWLRPTDRAADQVLRALTAGGPILSPGVFTPDRFAQVLVGSAGARVPAWRRRLALDEVVVQLVRQGGVPYFGRVAETRGFLDAAAGMLDEFESLGIAPADLGPVDDGPRAAKLAACADIFARVADRLGTPASPVAPAAALLDRGLPPPFDRVRTVFIDGFSSFTPPEWRLVEALARHTELRVRLPGDAGNRPDAFAGVEETRQRLVGLGAVVETDASDRRPRPAGLAHVQRHLFGPGVPATADAAGLARIEAPGPLGEARLVARRVRSLLAAGTPAEAVVVTARDLTYAADLIEEVFPEYGIPVEVERAEPVVRSPAVATLLRALRLADDGWPFAGVTALLRSTYFQPDWPEAADDAARHAEGLLRLLGEPRDRQAYLRAVRIWADAPPDGLDDEQAEESRRRRKARLAVRCRPFLERFFQAWDALPAAADVRTFTAAVRSLATDVGLDRSAAADARDGEALRALWAALESWDGGSLSRGVFIRRLAVLAGSLELNTARSAGRVRIVSAEEARHLDCDYLFVLGLGERSFPRLAPPPSLLDDADRNLLRSRGLPLPDPAGRLGAEQLLFLQLVGRPRRELILSFPAVDDRGQPLLPGSFLRAVRELFAPDAVPVERQRMLIEGYLHREPLSAAEARSRFAAALHAAEAVTPPGDLPAEMCEHVGWARQVAAARFGGDDFTRYDGWADSPTVLQTVRDRFGPDRVFSPTALESYVACPFRFLVEHVLGLEELEEPTEEVEHTRRGAAYHRALSRLHTKLREGNPEVARTKLPDAVGVDLLTEIDRAVQEYADRAPSPASRVLWELEGKRLHRSAARYRGHWEDFLTPWRKAGAVLDPQLFEADFGLTPAAGRVQSAAGSEGIPPLVIRVGDVEVRIGGRIDRVDVAELADGLGFWIIDYKTGRATSYSAADLTRFEKLQLPLYALAVERVFFPGRPGRPLGLAYWLVTDTGPKPVLPGSRQALAWLTDRKKWATFRQHLEAWVATIVGRIRDGQFPLAPRSDTCTDTCSFGSVCRIAQSRNTGKVWELSPAAGGAGEAND